MRSSAHGLSIEAPAGWDVRISQNPGAAPILHVATFTLKPGDGGFGAGATGRMGPDDSFAALVEYLVDERVKPGLGLFAGPDWSPRLSINRFSSSQLEVTRPGQLGHQRFFTHDGRPFCLYAVLAPVRERPERLLRALSTVLATLRFDG